MTYWATDAAGNVEAVKTGWVNISNPYAQATNLQADNHSGWRNTATTVTITGSGDHAPITIYYKLDTGSWQNVVSPASVPVSGEGSHSVVFYAVNSVGVQSSPETGYVNIDLTAPVTTATGLQAERPLRLGHRRASPVAFTASDALSGVSATYYTVDGGAQQLYGGGPVLIGGEGSAHRRLLVGRRAPATSRRQNTGYVNIDLTAPVTTRHEPAGRQPLRLAATRARR